MNSAQPVAGLVVLLLLTGGDGGISCASREDQESTSQQTETSAAEPTFDYSGLAYDDLNSERLRLKLTVHLRSPKQNLVLLRMAFENVTANELPLVVEPFEGTVALKSDEPTALPAPVYISLYFRELSSLDPVRRLLETRQVRLRGSVDVTMKFKGVEGVFTLGQNLHRSLPFEKAVPVDLLEHPLARPLAQVLLEQLADPKSSLGTRWVEQQLQLQSLRRHGEQLKTGLVLIQTRYRVLDVAGAAERELEEGGVGFLLAPDRVVTAKRVLEPWKYVPELAFLMQQGGYQVETVGYDVTLGPAGEAAVHLGPQQVDVAEKPADELVAADYDGPMEKVAVQVHRLDSPQGLVLLRLRASSQSATPLPTAALGEADEILLGITYVHRHGDAERIQAETSWTMARIGPDSVVLDRRFPDYAAGAPLFDLRGRVRAIFVGEDRCVPIQAATAQAGRKP